jgi:hypothetical protein
VSRALGLGFQRDTDIDSIVRQFVEEQVPSEPTK